MVKPLTRDHQRKSTPKTRNVRMAVITAETDASGAGQYTCNCGWIKFHMRAKVAEKAAGDHVDRKHKGKAMWL